MGQLYFVGGIEGGHFKQARGGEGGKVESELNFLIRLHTPQRHFTLFLPTIRGFSKQEWEENTSVIGNIDPFVAEFLSQLC